MLVTHDCCPSCHHPPGLLHAREGIEGQTLDTTGCGFPQRWGYNESQVLGRLVLPIGQAGNQFCEQGPGDLFALTSIDLRGNRVRVSPWGCPGSIPAPSAAASCYNIKSLDHRASYIWTTVMETNVIRVGMGKVPVGESKWLQESPLS